jgi:uncharacterized protein YdeI (YjbR/CyaY-like superfamily)
VSDEESVVFPSAEAFESWLAEHHAQSPGVWLRLRKKGSAAPGTVTYAEALESALCFGWIDGQKRSFDEDHWLQRFTPRSPRSRWSRINRDKAQELIEQGRMRPAGLAEIERARADGRWEGAYASARNSTVPDDLAAALAADPAAAAFFADLDGANRYAVLYRIEEAKRPETRARRIATYVRMLAEGRKLHP